MKQVHLAQQLLQRLPLFEHATLSEILDIRNELEKPLRRFRGLILKLSDKVTSAPWEPSFPAEVNELFLKEIETPVLDLEEAVRSNRYLVALTRKLVDKPLVLPAGTGIGMMLAKFPNLPPYVAPAAGAGVSAATVAYDAFQEWQQKRRAIEQNHLYFYYEMGRRLRRHR